MANIQQYTKSVLPSVSDGSNPLSGAVEGLTQVAGQYLKLKETQTVAKMNNSLADVKLDMLKATNNFRTQYQGDPNSDEGRIELDAQYNDIFTSRGMDYSGRYANHWAQATNSLQQSASLENYVWAEKQSQLNMVSDINQGMEKSLLLTAEHTRAGDIEGAKKAFQDTYNQLSSVGSAVLGSDVTKQQLADFEDDTTKVIISEQVYSNPIAALNSLSNDDVKKSLGSDYNKFHKMASDRVSNMASRKKQEGLIAFATEENDLYARSISEDVPIIELESAFARNNTPKVVRDVLYSLNGYSEAAAKDTKKESIKLSDTQKLEAHTNYLRATSSILSGEVVAGDDVQAIRLNINELVANDVISPTQGAKELEKWSKPLLQKMSNNLKTYKGYEKWGDGGSKIKVNAILDIYDENFKLEEGEDSLLGKGIAENINTQNELIMLESWEENIEKNMPDQKPIGDFMTLDSSERGKILRKANIGAIRDYAYKTVGYRARDDESEREIIAGVRNVQSFERQDLVNEHINASYDKPSDTAFNKREAAMKAISEFED